MAIEIRTPSEEEREELVRVLRVSLNFSADWMTQRGPLLPLEQFLCAYDGGRIVAAAAARPFTQWFGGNELPMTGVWGVATLPEHRGEGTGSLLVAEVAKRGRRQGALVSSLYPAALRPYRAIGFELAGTYTEHRIPLSDLPGDEPPLPVEEYRPGEDLDAVRACYRRVASDSTGPIDSDEAMWWPARILEPRNPDQMFRVVVVRGENGIEGYSSFTYENTEGMLGISFGIQCNHFVAASEPALRSLLAYFRGFRGLGQNLTWVGPPVDPAALVVSEQKLAPNWSFRWMTRLLDVPAALSARGYPPISGSAAIAVDDPLYPQENRGPWLITAEAGTVSVSRVDGAAPPRPIPIGALSAMFTGFVTPSDAVRIGVLDAGDPAVGFLSRLFAGPAPWMQDFF